MFVGLNKFIVTTQPLWCVARPPISWARIC